jgi:mono/diheme cytochrome c family protein
MKYIRWSVLTITLSFSVFAADKKVERTFNAKCGSCHGKDGAGQTDKGKKMKMRNMGSAEFQTATDEEMTKTITEGFKKDKDGVKQEMDSFKDELKPEEVGALVKYVREFKK